ncbi:MAG: GTP-binding protein [Planctomycetes bacterium]|nr:GTP-binding protein [Planctomycetota bacterium]
MIPLHVLTGFLGAGKTTLLRSLLQASNGERIAALVNEVGDLDVDRHLLERADDEVLALTSGCLCCELRGDLLAAVDRLLARRPTRIVLETSGAADPAPILHALSTHPACGRTFELAGVIAVVDAGRIEELLAAQPEARRQLEFADRLVLTHTAAMPEARLTAARALLDAAAPGCAQRLGDELTAAADPAWLWAPAPLARLRDPAATRLWLHHGDHGSEFRSHTVALPAAASIEPLRLWLRLVTQFDGARLLRIKGLAECRDSGAVFALQSAGPAVSPPRRLAAPPAHLRGVNLVLIERGLPATVLDQAVLALRSAAAATRA